MKLTYEYNQTILSQKPFEVNLKFKHISWKFYSSLTDLYQKNYLFLNTFDD